MKSLLETSRRIFVRTGSRYLWLALIACGLLSAQSAEARKALLIGNGTYANKPDSCWENVQTCVDKSLDLMTTALGGCDWTVTKQKNRALADMRKDVTGFCPGAENSEATLFYYLGHGEKDAPGRGEPVGVDDDCNRSGIYKAADFAADFKPCNGRYYSWVVVECCGAGMFITDVDAELQKLKVQAILFASTRNAAACGICTDTGAEMTKVIASGLAGPADKNHDGAITADELDAYLTANYDPGRADDEKHLYIVHGTEGQAPICGTLPTPVSATSWGRIKAMYH